MDSKNHSPLKSNLSYAYFTSILIVGISSAISIYSLIFQDRIYPAEDLLQSFVPNDIVNLLIGIPTLIFSLITAKKGKTVGLLFWGGAIIFNLYNLIAYLVALPLQWHFIIYFGLLILNIFTLIKLIASIDRESIKQLFHDRVYEKFCGGVLTGFGALFFIRAISVLANALFYGEILSRIELTPNLSDLMIAPAFIFVGISLWRKKAWGYIGGLGLLFLASMLFVGLILFLLLQPVLTSAAFSPTDFFVVLIMGLICFIPFALFLRGVLLSSQPVK